MSMTKNSYPTPHRDVMHCAEELLFHTSRYYVYSERFLADLAGRPDFSMVGYDCRRLSENQQKVLSGLLTEVPALEIARKIIKIVSDVTNGIKEVDAELLQKYEQLYFRGCPCCFHHHVNGRGTSLANETSPVDPIQNMAQRLHIPIEIKGSKVRMPMRILRKYLDSANAVIRQNIQDDILMLHDGGYRLVNMPYEPKKKRNWNKSSGDKSPRFAIQGLFNWRSPPSEREL